MRICALKHYFITECRQCTKPEPVNHLFHRLRIIFQAETAAGSDSDPFTESFVQESLIVSDHHHRLNLFDRLKHNAYHDDQARPSERYRSVEHAPEDEGKDADDRKSDRADKDNVIQDPVQVIARGLARTDSGDKAAALFQVVSNLKRIKCDRRVKIRKEYQQYDIHEKSDRIFDLGGIAPVGGGEVTENFRPDSSPLITGQRGDNYREFHERGCEDDRHNARCIYLERYNGIRSADKSSSLDLLSVLYRDPSLSVIEDDDQDDHQDDDRDNDHCCDRADGDRLTKYELREQ